MNCITHASLAIQQLRTSTLNACWKSIWPECIKGETSIPQTTVLSSEIVYLAHKIGGEGFEDIQTEDIDELLIDKLLGEDEIIEQITGEINTPNAIRDEEEEVETRQLTASLMREGLKFGSNMVNHFLKLDPNLNMH